MRFSWKFAAVLVMCAACADDPTQVKTPEPEPVTPVAPKPLGVFEVTLSGLAEGAGGSANVLTSKVREVTPAGVRTSMTPITSGLTLEAVGASAFTDCCRNFGGQRYVSFTYRVRNGTGVPHNNVAILWVGTAGTFPGTPISSLKRVDGANADTSIASKIAPTGNVALGSDHNTMLALYPDVMQAYTEAEVAAIAAPAGVTNVFPIGFSVRSRNSTANRTLPATADPNQFDGEYTLSLRIPLQSSNAADVNVITLQIMAIEDTETRLTESIEESQDTAAVRRLRDLATSLGATTVTVLNGSPAMDPAVPDYPGQRQICNLRIAGTAAVPTNTIITPAGYQRLLYLNPGETLDYCAPYFRGGTPSRPALNVPYTVTIAAFDRYGNLRTGQPDTVRLEEVSGPPYVTDVAAGLSGGSITRTVTYTDYGTAMLRAVGKRLRGTRPMLVAGVTRTWTGNNHNTNWSQGDNWSPAAVPGVQDSVYVPVSPAGGAFFPALVANVTVQGVTVEDVATISLGAFDLSAGGNVTAGLTGGITNTSGRLFLTGIARTVQGKLPVVRVTGTYSLTGNVNSRASVQVDAGRLTVSGFRWQSDSN